MKIIFSTTRYNFNMPLVPMHSALDLIQGVGAYTYHDGSTILENSYMLEVEALNKATLDLCDSLIEQYAQESILIDIDGAGFLFTSSNEEMTFIGVYSRDVEHAKNFSIFEGIKFTYKK